MMSKCRGWDKVCMFTFVQTFKAKSTIITTILLFLVALLALPVSDAVTELITGSEDDGEPYAYEKVYIIDKTGLELHDFSGMDTIDKRYQDVEFSVEEREEKEIVKAIEKEEEAALIMTISYDAQTGFLLHGTYVEKSGVGEEDTNSFAIDATEYFQDYLIANLNIAEDTLAYINMPVKSKVVMMGADGKAVKKAKGTGISGAEYAFSYAVLFVFMMCVTMSGEGVASAIVVEKANRVVEYLLTSIEPMAIVVGKVIARLAVILVQLGLAGIGFVISVVICGLAGETSGSSDMAKKVEEVVNSGILSNVQPYKVVLAIIIMLLGFLFYGMFAGLAGAAVSKVEDTAEGLKLFTIVILVGVYLAIAIIMTGLNGDGNRTLEYIGYLLPLSSPFIIPSYLWLGKVSAGIALGAFAILLACTVAEIYFVSTIYGNLIFYNGNILKAKDIIKMFRENSKGRGESHEE